MDALQRIAHTLLYEGYVLWPYRRSAIKNQQRWTFGGVYPRAYAEISGGSDRSVVRTECLFESTAALTADGNGGTSVDASDVALTISVRFLHVLRRQLVSRVTENGVPFEKPVNEITVAGTRYLSWDEAAERTRDIHLHPMMSERTITHPLRIAAGEDREPLFEGGVEIGAIVRSWEAIDASISATVTMLSRPAQGNGAGLYRVSVSVSNDSVWQGTVRDESVRRTLVSTHIVLQARGAAFVSQFDAPTHLAEHSRANSNEGLWPMLVGVEGERHTLLASPIILYDYPALAPESPGDLFDGGEIDQLLILNVLTLTEDEQCEMRDSDPRTRQILERCQGLSNQELAGLHGIVRSLEEQTSRYSTGT